MEEAPEPPSTGAALVEGDRREHYNFHSAEPQWPATRPGPINDGDGRAPRGRAEPGVGMDARSRCGHDAMVSPNPVGADRDQASPTTAAARGDRWPPSIAAEGAAVGARGPPGGNRRG